MDSPHQRLERTGVRNPPLLPPEVIYTIARQIPQKSDLLSFGLVHSAFHDVVIPYYLKFREVIMGLDNIRMWEYLVGDPRRLASVEVLQIAPNLDQFAKNIGPQPPLPKNAASTGADPLDTIQRALQGMTRLREVLWDENFGRREYREERQVDMKECKQTFWAAMPRLCKGIDTITIITTSHLNDSSCWLCGHFLSELHHLPSLRAFTGDFFPCKHNQSDLLAPQARTSQTSIVSAFSRLRELSLNGAELKALPGMQFPSLMALSLVGEVFDTSDGLLRMLESCPRLHSLHLELEGSATLASDEVQGDSLPSLDIVPMLTSLTGSYEDARIIFFSPLPDGRLRRISRLKINGGSVEDLLPPLVSDFEDSATGVGQDLLELTIHTICDRNQDESEIERLFWVTWLETIVNSCPKLRGLIFDIDDPNSEWDGLEETDGWRPTLSPLKDLTVLKLPNSVWRGEVDDPVGSEDDVEGLVDEFLEWFPHLRLFFPTDDLALVIDPEGGKAVTLPEERDLFYSDQAMERNWAFYGHLSWQDFDEEIERLLA